MARPTPRPTRPSSQPACFRSRPAPTPCPPPTPEAVHGLERMVDALALKLNMDPAELRQKNFIQPEQFPYKSALGWEYDSGNYPAALQKALETIGYADLRKEQA